MKYFLFIIIFFTINSFLNASQWHVDNSPYRIKLKQTKTESSFIPENYLLPNPINKGARAFTLDGKEITLKWDNSSRAFIIVGDEKEEEFYIYPSNVTLEFDTTKNMLTMYETAARHQAANKEQYLANKNKSLINRSNNRYNYMLDKFKLHYAESLILPPTAGKLPMNSWWDVNNNHDIASKKNVNFGLFSSNALKRNYYWRLSHYFPMKAFFYDVNSYKNRMYNEVNYYINLVDKSIKEWETAKTANHEEIISQEFEKNFKKLEESNRAKKTFPSKMSIITKKMDMNAHVLLKYLGNLNIKEDGLYEFEILTNAFWEMKIDDKVVAKDFLSNDPNELVKHSFKVELNKGVKKFSFVYARGNSIQDLVVKFKNPQGEELILNENNFVPVEENNILEIELKDATNYPIIKVQELGAFMTGKQEFQQLLKLDLPENANIAVINEAIDTNIIATSNLKNNSNWTIKYKDNIFPLPQISKPKNPEIYDGTFAVKLQTPPIIYSDEENLLTFEIRNNFPLTLPVIFEYKIYNGNNLIDNFREFKNIGHGFSNHLLELNLDEGRVEISVSLAGYVVATETLHIISAQNISENMNLSLDRFKYEDKQLLIKLKRMSTSDLREWEFVELFTHKDIKNILVLGEITNITNIIKKSWKKEISSTTIIPWEKEDILGNSRLLKTLPKILEKIRNNSFDAIIISLPTTDISIIGQDNFYKYSAIIFENIYYKNGIEETIILNTENSEIPKQLAREYGFELF